MTILIAYQTGVCDTVCVMRNYAIAIPTPFCPPYVLSDYTGFNSIAKAKKAILGLKKEYPGLYFVVVEHNIDQLVKNSEIFASVDSIVANH